MRRRDLGLPTAIPEPPASFRVDDWLERGEAEPEFLSSAHMRVVRRWLDAREQWSRSQAQRPAGRPPLNGKDV